MKGSESSPSSIGGKMKSKILMIISIIAIISVSVFAWGLSDHTESYVVVGGLPTYSLSEERTQLIQYREEHKAEQRVKETKAIKKLSKQIKINKAQDKFLKQVAINQYLQTIANNRAKAQQVRRVYVPSNPCVNCNAPPPPQVSGGICTSNNHSGCIPAQFPCAIPDYICRRESGPVMYINIRYAGPVSSNAAGKYQFLASTFAVACRYAGLSCPYSAADAPEWMQDKAAAALYNSPGGSGHWGM
jgi:hypothetical protein